MPKRVVFTPWGSFGDIHPHLALAVEMKNRGYDVVVATCEVYREKIEREGVGFAPVRPDVGPFAEKPELVEQLMDAKKGPERLVRTVLMPSVEETYTDLKPIVADADLIISHNVSYLTPILAEELKKKWLSIVLQPLLFFSVYDLPDVPEVSFLKKLPVVLRKAFIQVVRLSTGAWYRELARFRERHGFGPGRHPLFGAQFSPLGTLALFSPVLAQPQRDWPAQTHVTGFAFYDKAAPKQGKQYAELEEFLGQGEAPIVFTLGTSSAFVPGHFFKASAEAAKQLNRRAVLLTVQSETDIQPAKDLFITDYAPFSELFPRASAIVHSAGIGTGGLALRAGKPNLMIPFGQDQPDNAARIARLGVGEVIQRDRYDASTAASALQRILSDTSMAARAETISQQVRKESGVKNACDLMEAQLL